MSTHRPIYKILVVEEKTAYLKETYFSNESLEDIRRAIEKYLAIYDSKEDIDYTEEGEA